ncbi:ABC transporter permease [Paracraurococcus lichenis]|uniref:ABC transporter permease n=1 Tax=Paracraurococcus lichenis TaxID=3064888 RepID=A0ABT9E5L1_9PROT|nr:ABC transporter permease [Paracraurococcus sp. LOR1-02]MDO9711454.1 ABC transporter permease [Paracraurococcus sp. LOR1-02]
MTPPRYLAARLAQVLPVVLMIVTANFFLMQLAPGDMADVMAGEAGAATPEFLASLRAAFGADQPLATRFLQYLGRVLTLDLGFSFRNGKPVLDLILSRAPATALLLGSSLVVALAVGVSLGWVAARGRGGWADRAVSLVTTIGFATPLFWVGLMMIVLFAVELRWLPTGGIYDADADLTGMAFLLDVARHLVMPVMTLAIFYVAIYARLSRAAVLEVEQLDFVRTARAKGLSRRRIALAHVLRNALLPVVTMTGLQLGTLLSGALVVETVFAWPGMGRLTFDAVNQRDLNLLLGILFCTSLLVILVNLATDLVYALLDPRIELR